MKANISESKAVDSQNLCQSHDAGKIFPIAPKPPNCVIPLGVKTYSNCFI